MGSIIVKNPVNLRVSILKGDNHIAYSVEFLDQRIKLVGEAVEHITERGVERVKVPAQTKNVLPQVFDLTVAVRERHTLTIDLLLGLDRGLEIVVGVDAIDGVDVLGSVLDNLVSNQFVALGRSLPKDFEDLFRLLGQNTHHISLLNIKHLAFSLRLVMKSSSLIEQNILVAYVIALFVDVGDFESALSNSIVLEILETYTDFTPDYEVHLLYEFAFLPYDRWLAVGVRLEDTRSQAKN